MQGKLSHQTNMRWYVIHTKPRQEQRALLNLQQQGYTCYLPLLAIEKLRHGALTVVQEPLFSRYLFIELDTGQSGPSWGPIRSTLGVSRLVSFGAEPATISADLIEQLHCLSETAHDGPERMFKHGELVQIKDGPFAGIEGIYQMDDGDRRAMVLIELLSRPSALAIAPGSLRKLSPASDPPYGLNLPRERHSMGVHHV